MERIRRWYRQSLAAATEAATCFALGFRESLQPAALFRSASLCILVSVLCTWLFVHFFEPIIRLCGWAALYTAFSVANFALIPSGSLIEAGSGGPYFDPLAAFNGLAGLAQLAFYFVGYAALFFVALYAASIVFGIRLGLRIGLLGQLKEQVRQRYPRLAPASGERISLWRAAGFRLAPWLGVSGSILVGLLVPLYNGVLLLLALAYLNIRFLLPATLAVLGAATLGVLSSLLVSPCVSAPLAASLLYISASGDAWGGGLQLFALGLGMGTPLVVFGAGGGALLPKSGAWMNGVRNAFGVLLLAVAVWLLERVVSGPVALMLWGMLAGGAGLALGALEFTPKSAARRLLQLLGLMFLTYAVAAWIGALQGESDPIHPLGRSVPSIHAGPPSTPGEWQNLTTPAQLDAALAEARQAGKPVLLDWYADWCISCKVIERQVLTDPTVQARLPAYRLLRFDITESNPAQRGLLDRYNLFGPPAILFFAPGGDEWSDLRVIGEIDAAGLAERLRRAATRQ